MVVASVEQRHNSFVYAMSCKGQELAGSGQYGPLWCLYMVPLLHGSRVTAW
jgi:hypothetical protein